MANFNLDRFKFRWKGTWIPETTYKKDDIVYYEGKAFVCLEEHASRLNFYEDRYAADLDQTLTITVSSDTINAQSQGKFYINGEENPELILLKGRTYTIDQSDGSNVIFNSQQNVFLFSNSLNGTLAGATEYSEGVRYLLDNEEVSRLEYEAGFPSAVLRQIEFTISENAPDKLYYYSPTNLDMGAKLNTRYSSFWELMFDGYIWKSDWQANTFYPEGSIVKYKGYLYQAIQSHTSTTVVNLGLPTDIEKWIIYATTYNWLNEWSEGAYYELGDVVRYNGRTYICAEKHLSDTTVNGLEADVEKWVVTSRSDNWRGDWDIETRYVQDDLVKYGAIVYRCLDGHTSAATLALGLEADQALWEIVAEGIEYKNVWQNEFRYKKGDIVKYGSSLWKANTGHTSTTADVNLRGDEALWNIWVPGLEYERLWNSSTEYQKGDIVLYGGYSYTALNNNRESAPSANLREQDTGDWELLTTGYKHKGEWDETEQYLTGDIVRNSGYLYIAVDDNENTYPDLDPSIWTVLVEGDQFRSEWEDNTEYFLGDIILYAGTAYICINRHISSESGSRPDLDQDYDQEDFWSVLIQGSPNNVLSAVGDIKVYGDETERLPISSEGRVLKTDGSDNVTWQDYEFVPNVYYVSPDGVDTDTAGTTPSNPFASVKFACEYIAADTLARTPATVLIKTGLYREQLPIVVPKDTALVGDELRSTNIQPEEGFEQQNMFLVRNGSGIRNMTLQGLTGTLGAPNAFLTRRPTAGAYVSLDPGNGPDDESVWISSKSPYIQNVTTFGTACIGMKVDGALHNGGNRSIVANDFTQVISDGIGYWADNVGRSELVSVFTYYCHIGYLCTNGGILRATNGNNSYGEYGTVAEGFDLRESPVTTTVNNKSTDAQFSEAFTYGTTEQEILAIGYSHAGEAYTTADITFGGSGLNAEAIYDASEIRNGALSDVRVLGYDDSTTPGGLNYTFVVNNAQVGDSSGITIAQADIAETEEEYLGQRIVIISGIGVGQYGEITAFDPVSKEIIVSRESDGSLGWDHFQPGWPIENVLDETTRYAIEPRIEFDEPRFSAVSYSTPETRDWKYIAYGNDIWVTANTDGKFTYSTNLVSWNPTITYDDGLVGNLIYDGANFILMYEAGPADADVNEIHIGDGTSFSSVSLPFSAKWNDIAYDGSGGVIVTATDSVNYAISTSSGAGWSTGTITGSVAQNWSSVSYGNGMWVALDSTNGDIAYSEDGSTWTIKTAEVRAVNWSETVYGNNRFVSIAPVDGDNVATAYSFDGITWYESEIEEGDFEHISYAQGVFLATGTGRLAAKSQDGKVWRTFDDGSSAYNLTESAAWGQSVYHDGEWVIVSDATWNTLATGAKPIVRAKLEGSRFTEFVIYDPGSGYSQSAGLSIIDNQSTLDVLYQVNINDGVLAQPRYANRGEGYVTITAEISGDGLAEIYQTGTTLIVSNLTSLPGPGANIDIFGIDDRRYSLIRINSFKGEEGDYEASIEITPSIQVLESPDHDTEIRIRERYSQARLTGHDFLDIGTGNFNSTRYPLLYLEGEDSLNARQPFNETVAKGGGRVFYTSTDQDGNFRVGELFEVEQNTGIVTINATQFDLGGLTELSLGGIQVGGSAVVIREFSKDPNFTANSNNVVPTEKAILSFIEGRISGGGANASTNTLVAGQVQFSSNQVTTTSGLQINVDPVMDIRGGVDGHYLALQYYASAGGFPTE